MNDHTKGFHPQTQKLELLITQKSTTEEVFLILTPCQTEIKV